MLSELQHAGRGRRGRHWIAPFGCGVALSMGWSFTDASKASPTLSLSVGVAVARALARAGALGLGLKWPNDIWLGERKIGGVLIELRAEAGGPAHVVIGVGVNVILAPATRAQIEAVGVQVAAVADACTAPPRAISLPAPSSTSFLSMLADFEREGFAAFRAAWTALDVLRDRPAQVLTGENVISGTARGVNAHGALQLEREGRCTNSCPARLVYGGWGPFDARKSHCRMPRIGERGLFFVDAWHRQIAGNARDSACDDSEAGLRGP